jgi:aryl-alcohol dehydrogenase-like predicted oxidoreductase
MRTRSLGKTGLRIGEMSLGTWGLSGDGYGEVDATSPPRKRFDAPYLRERVEASLRRLACEPIDVYLLHNPSENAIEGGEAIDQLAKLKDEGKIAHWGVSSGDVDVGRAALRKGAEVIELAYSLVHPAELHRLAGEIIVSGAGVLARSTLAYGLLAGCWTREKEFAPGDHRTDRWTKPELDRRIDQLAAIRFLVRGDIPTMRSAAVRFVLSNNIVSSAVLGPRNVEQLEDIVREVGMGPIYLTDEDLMRIPRALQAMGIEP